METAEVAKSLLVRETQEGDFSILHDFPPCDIEKAWRDCLSRVESPAHYNSPEFFLEPYWAGKRPFAVLAWDGGKVIGILTGLHEGDCVISGLQSRPQICIDRTADPTEAMGGLARGLLTESRSARLVSVYSWSCMPLDSFESYGFRRRELEGNVVLDLTRNSEVLFKELNKKRRTNIRSAIRNGIDVFPAATPEDTATFYHIYRAWRQTTRKTISGDEISWPVFEQRFQQPENFRFFLARHSGNVIAGITLRFFAGGLVEYSNNSSLDQFLNLRPNDLLVWRAIEWASSQGFQRFSLGGAHRFLREFGGEVVSIWRYRLDRTLLRQHDLQQAVQDAARSSFRKFPHPVQKTVRRLLGKKEL